MVSTISTPGVEIENDFVIHCLNIVIDDATRPAETFRAYFQLPLIIMKSFGKKFNAIDGHFVPSKLLALSR